jgi:hypothetical protein
VQWPTPLALVWWVLVYLGLCVFGWLIGAGGWSWLIAAYATFGSLAQNNSVVRRIEVRDGLLKLVPLHDIETVEVLDLRGTKAARGTFRWYSPVCWCPHWLRSSLLIHTRAPEGMQGRFLVGTRQPHVLAGLLAAASAEARNEQRPFPDNWKAVRRRVRRLSWELILFGVFVVAIVFAPLVRDGDWLATLLLGLTLLALPIVLVVVADAKPLPVVTVDELRLGRRSIGLHDLRSARVAPIGEIGYLAGLTDFRKRRGKPYGHLRGVSCGLVLTVEGGSGVYPQLVTTRNAAQVAAALHDVRPELFSVQGGRA